MLKYLSAVAAMSAALALAACGDEASPVASAPVKTVTVTEPAPSAPVEEESTADAAFTEDVSDDSESTDSSDDSSGSITVPDVEGHDHQLAQDEMQAAGLYMLDEEDATGQGRMLLWDRNWTVVSQDPPAGTKVSADTEIMLSSKKDGE